MARRIVGPAGFEYEYLFGEQPDNLLALSERSGTGRNRYRLQLVARGARGGQATRDLGWRTYPRGTDPDEFLGGVIDTLKKRVPRFERAFVAQGLEAPISLHQNVSSTYALRRREWSAMLAWLNGLLPRPQRLASKALAEAEGQTVKRWLAALRKASASSRTWGSCQYLPYLGAHVLVHAVRHGLATMTVEETDGIDLYPEDYD